VKTGGFGGGIGAALCVAFAVSAVLGAVCAFAQTGVETDTNDAPHIAARWYARGDLVTATKVLQEAVAVRPTDAQLHFMLGNALFRQTNWDGAIHHYEEAARLREHHPDTHLSLGFAYLYAGCVDDAVKAWGKAVDQTPDDALACFSLAIGLKRQGGLAEARKCAGRAIALDAGWLNRLKIDMRWRPEMVREVQGLVAEAAEAKDRTAKAK
jgi:tetratricopeptide (TPR) repeat protein